MRISRRRMLESIVASAAVAAGGPALWSANDTSIIRRGRIQQSVCQWCYPHISLNDLTAYAAHIGLKGVDLLNPDQYEVPRRYGLICTMGYAEGGQIAQGLNRLENHAAIERGFRKNIPLAAKAGVPNVITFSGNRAGMSDEQGAKNTEIGLNRVKKIAEDHGVTICLELLNSKVNHKDYMCDHTAWGVDVMQQVNSPNVKLLYDIYHMQIMEGDLIDTIQQNIQWIGHFHTGGVPGRHELNDQQ
ncbi:MAG TPA: TIM barrel protein, partial [Acidobacteriaceae bacterium]|nr:TIM barrel protein [Acidobacteriaceae bacterium]